MGDVAQIISGLGNASSNNNKPKAAGPPKPPPPLPKGHHPSRAMKMAGMPKEVMDLVGGKQDPLTAALPPVVPSFPITIGGATASASAAGAASTTSDAIDPNMNSITTGHTVKVGNKWIDTSKPARKWVWANFASSARTDGLLLNHWVRHGIDYPDYPYAKFDIHLDVISYTEEEYSDRLQHPSWTKSETDQLMELARKLELRWPVIYDRWFGLYQYTGDNANENSPAQAAVSRKMEDLQHRYYTVAAVLMQHRIAKDAASEAKALAETVLDPSSANPKAAADALLSDTAAARVVAAADPKHQPLIHNLGTGSSNKIFDLNYERERRAHLESLWHRTKEEEEEELILRKEMRLVEAQIRKLKKSGGHILAATDAKGGSGGAGGASTASGGAASSREASREASRASSPADASLDDIMTTNSPEALLEQCFASTAPVPTPGTPYLQSGRLAPPAAGGSTGLNKTLLGRMDTVLEELNIPERPIPTKRVCDQYDSVRKDVLTLLTLQKMLLQKEGQLQSKRMKLSKMGGSIQVADEETALGILKPQPTLAPVPATPATASTSTKSKKSTGGKGKGTATGGGGGKGKSGGGKSTKVPAGTAGAASTTKAKTDGKSKGGSKSGDGKSKTAAAPASSAAGGKQTQGVKQAPVTGGKQVPGGKQLPGGKTKKSSTKRKRKAESKSPVPTAATSGGAVAPAAAAAKLPVGSAAAVVAGVPSLAVATSAAGAKPTAAGETKSAGKKRARKS